MHLLLLYLLANQVATPGDIYMHYSADPTPAQRKSVSFASSLQEERFYEPHSHPSAQYDPETSTATAISPASAHGHSISSSASHPKPSTTTTSSLNTAITSATNATPVQPSATRSPGNPLLGKVIERKPQARAKQDLDMALEMTAVWPHNCDLQ